LLRGTALNSWYGDVQILRDVSFQVDAGEIVAVVGANAAGKSTLLLLVSGLLSRLGGRMTGEVALDGQRIDGLPPNRIVSLGLVQVMEGRRLFPYMTVQENLDLGAYGARARAAVRESLDEVFELLPVLRDRRTQLAGSLSGGEQQMCAIGRGLMARPRVLTLDEPTIGLAPLYVEKTFEILKTINARGTTILLVEQNVRHSLTLARRGYVLENGRVVLQGRGQDLLANDALRTAYLGV
jgi:branched-chain amino acid transport system ATP-binding protein